MQLFEKLHVVRNPFRKNSYFVVDGPTFFTISNLIFRASKLDYEIGKFLAIEFELLSHEPIFMSLEKAYHFDDRTIKVNMDNGKSISLSAKIQTSVDAVDLFSQQEEVSVYDGVGGITACFSSRKFKVITFATSFLVCMAGSFIKYKEIDISISQKRIDLFKDKWEFVKTTVFEYDNDNGLMSLLLLPTEMHNTAEFGKLLDTYDFSKKLSSPYSDNEIKSVPPPKVEGDKLQSKPNSKQEQEEILYNLSVHMTSIEIIRLYMMTAHPMSKLLYSKGITLEDINKILESGSTLDKEFINQTKFNMDYNFDLETTYKLIKKEITKLEKQDGNLEILQAKVNSDKFSIPKYMSYNTGIVAIAGSNKSYRLPTSDIVSITTDIFKNETKDMVRTLLFGEIKKLNVWKTVYTNAVKLFPDDSNITKLMNAIEENQYFLNTREFIEAAEYTNTVFNKLQEILLLESHLLLLASTTSYTIAKTILAAPDAVNMSIDLVYMIPELSVIIDSLTWTINLYNIRGVHEEFPTVINLNDYVDGPNAGIGLQAQLLIFMFRHLFIKVGKATIKYINRKIREFLERKNLGTVQADDRLHLRKYFENIKVNFSKFRQERSEFFSTLYKEALFEEFYTNLMLMLMYLFDSQTRYFTMSNNIFINFIFLLTRCLMGQKFGIFDNLNNIRKGISAIPYVIKKPVIREVYAHRIPYSAFKEFVDRFETFEELKGKLAVSLPSDIEDKTLMYQMKDIVDSSDSSDYKYKRKIQLMTIISCLKMLKVNDLESTKVQAIKTFLNMKENKDVIDFYVKLKDYDTTFLFGNAITKDDIETLDKLIKALSEEKYTSPNKYEPLSIGDYTRDEAGSKNRKELVDIFKEAFPKLLLRKEDFDVELLGNNFNKLELKN